MASQRLTAGRTQQATQLKQRRTEQLDYVSGLIGPLESRLQEEQARNGQLLLLDSVSRGLYDEVDKLTKKAPAEEVTDLVLTQVNDIIKETKQLIPDDSYVQRLVEFVPAGNNPQHRDVVVVLRLIRQGLERFGQRIDLLIASLKARLGDAKSMQVALRLFLEDSHPINETVLERHGVKVSREWLDEPIHGKFDFERLDNVSLSDYVGQ